MKAKKPKPEKVTLGDLLETLEDILEAILKSCEPKKPKARLIVFATGHDEPIEKPTHMDVTLSKPIKPGYRRQFTVSTDEAIDKQPDGSYAKTEVVDGDSRAPEILAESTATLLKGWIYGDGAIGQKKVRITADGHIGEGEVAITLDISYEVQTPDATAFTNFQEGADEVIPTP